MLLMLVFLTGNLTIAVLIFGASVICTLGIGGVLWVGLAILIGAILQLLFPFLRSKADLDPVGALLWLPSASSPGPTKPTQSWVPEAMVTYAIHKLQLGVGEDVVRRNLLRNGWSEAQIADVLAVAYARMDAATQDGIEAGWDAD